LTIPVNLTEDKSVSEDRTKDLPTKHSFEQQVLARLDAIDSRLNNIETRLKSLEAKKYDTKPIWERALKEVAETRQEMNERFEMLEASITVLSGDVTRLRGSGFTIKRHPEKTEPEKKRA
jgi:uncharacterized protein YhaN